VGDDWRAIFIHFYEAMGEHFPDKARKLVYFAPDAEAAVKMLGDLTAKKN
jgi:hypothetical protein